jgi:hypothetical protein
MIAEQVESEETVLSLTMHGEYGRAYMTPQITLGVLVRPKGRTFLKTK